MNQQHLRRERTAFLLFLGACFVALMAALPIVTAQSQKHLKQAPPVSAAAGATAADQPSFEQVDRNKDGFIDKSEAGVVPGMSANFERADRSRDGRLDKAEFAKALEILQVRR